MTRVIGVFDNDSDLEVALNRLYDKGYNDVRVVDRSRENGDAVNNIPAGAFAPAVANNSGSAAPNSLLPVGLVVPGFFGLGDDTFTGAYFSDALGYTDMSEEETEFYANAVRNNGKLLIVDTDKADEAWAVMRNSNGSQYIKTE